MKKSKSVCCCTASHDGPCPPAFASMPPPGLPKISVANFMGAQAHVYAEHAQGELPENRNGMRSSRVSVRFSRAQRDPDSDHFDIAIGVGNEVIVRMTPQEFTDAFLAVVPRWLWKPRDER